MLLELFAGQGFRPLAAQMVRNNQTFLDPQTLALREPYARMFGQPTVQVTPALLAGAFQFPFGEGGMPTDKTQEIATLKDMIQMGMQSGAPMPAMPWNAIWARFLWQLGFKDVGTWGLSLKDIAVAPDAQVQSQVQQGNLQPAAANGRVPTDGFAMPPQESVPH